MPESKTPLKYRVNKKCLANATSSINSDKLGSPAVIAPLSPVCVLLSCTPLALFSGNIKKYLKSAE